MNVVPLEVGAEIEAHDIQISASNSAGLISMVDLEFQDKRADDDEELTLYPGHWLLRHSSMFPITLSNTNYFETDTSALLMRHFRHFTSKTEVYTKLGLPPKRGILLGSDPGIGKTSLINYFSRKLLEEYGDTVSINRLATEKSNWDAIQSMFTRVPEESKSLKLVVLIIEDIGGAALNERMGQVESSLLNFLDGNDFTTNIPTLIIGTTNYINELGNTLTDRPGRFDIVLHVAPPADSEITYIAESLLDRKLTESEAKALLGKRFTPAYCKEIVIRSLLSDESIETCCAELEKQRKLARDRKHGDTRRPIGMGD